MSRLVPGSGELGGLHLHDLIVGGSPRCPLGGAPGPLLLQSERPPAPGGQQRRAAVGGVVGHADLRAVLELLQAGGLAGVDAEGSRSLCVSRAHQVGVPFSALKVEQLASMLPFHRGVGLECSR